MSLVSSVWVSQCTAWVITEPCGECHWKSNNVLKWPWMYRVFMFLFQVYSGYRRQILDTNCAESAMLSSTCHSILFPCKFLYTPTWLGNTSPYCPNRSEHTNLYTPTWLGNRLGTRVAQICRIIRTFHPQTWLGNTENRLLKQNL